MVLVFLMNNKKILRVKQFSANNPYPIIIGIMRGFYIGEKTVD